MPAPIADIVSVPSGTTVVRGGIAGGPDTTPPSWGSATLAASQITSTSYTLTASAPATDNVGVVGYEYSVDGGTTWIANGLALSVNVSGRTPGSTDHARYRAFDAAGNRSAALAVDVTLSTGTASPWDPVKALLQPLPEQAWVRLNLNLFQAAWPSQDSQALMDSGRISTAGAIIYAWSSFALDDARGRIMLWGGGHANTNDNSMYFWNASTRRWTQAFLPTDNFQSPTTGLWVNVEPWDKSPPSAHTYGNNAYLPVLDRFITFGGAAWNTGHAFYVHADDGTEIRPLPCYTADLSKAEIGDVGGTTGTNVQRNTTAGLILTGANAWTPRDYLLDHPATTATAYLAGHLQAFVAGRTENGHDVLYVSGSTQVGASGNNNLIRIEFIDLDYHHDLVTIVGKGGGNLCSDQGGAFDTVNNFVLACGYPSQPIEGWNLDTASPTNLSINVPDSAIGGGGIASYIAAMNAHYAVRNQSYGMGILFDSERARFVMWGGLPQLWTTSTPADLVNGWIVEELPAALNDAPQYGAETGVHGKWKYSALMDCYIGIVDPTNGDVWAYKPENWNPKA
ncbi:MAG: hypothetical protein JSR59_02355 [Proteobacteria bacterium]|nr:hypothetical protein [Pseudomonadota bacterium]